MMRQREAKRGSQPGTNGTNGANGTNGTNGSFQGSPSKRKPFPSGGTVSSSGNRSPFFYLLFGAVVGVVCYVFFQQRQPSCAVDVALLNAAGTSGGAIVSIKTPPKHYAYQPKDLVVKSSKKLFKKMPKKAHRTFFAHMSKINHGMIRALRDQGWTKVEKREDARFIYTYTRMTSWYPKLQSWQRYNHVPNTAAWNQKDKFSQGFREWEQATGIKAYFVPETFDLMNEDEEEEFRKRLFEQGGLDHPWVLKIPNVNQGKGITMLGPNSQELKDVLKTVAAAKGTTRHIIQQYICNEMTWNRRKFDVRVYWLVASLDPLIVFYIDGYVRIGNAEYDESDFSNTRNHLTTHTFLGEEGKASYEQLNQHLLNHVDENPYLKETIKDPVSHVRNQFKESIGMLVDAFKGRTFKTGPPLAAEDAFEFYGADCVIDNDLDLWMIEAQDDTGMDEDHYFRLDMHHEIFYGMGLVLAEIWDKQAKGLPILPLENTGRWELVYADGWRFESPDGYERSQDKKSCGLPDK